MPVSQIKSSNIILIFCSIIWFISAFYFKSGDSKDAKPLKGFHLQVYLNNKIDYSL